MINAGNAWIVRNNITENNDGIIAITSVADIINNEVHKNKSSGIMLLKDSRPRLTDNKIHGNDCIGLFVRDKSVGVIKDNMIEKNKIDLLVEKRNKLLDNILDDNNLSHETGDIRIPQNYYSCNIF